ncbi:PREDICTED: uncharacterized protein LOC105448593 [Wasmannia auropunctata]|uniref:uncharacterized protein LOC105448593 n=1 Tax=Wasmannia auropunctata TaxID=64793 RepID=UPI0005EEF9A7|nr:PREDICTED: uncharacterized protein LOC105448593 [Wasmannia auropunctata]
MIISSELEEDFRWWYNTLINPNQSNCILSGRFACEIFSDASLTGWGASSSLDRTHGWWSYEDKALHINVLELKAAFYALKCFASDRHDCEILLRIDNTTAIAYINRFGSIKYPSLSIFSKAIWQWCEVRNIWLFASYIASAENVIADEESRRLDSDTEWSLSSEAFQLIDFVFGPFDLDLFASNINAKCDRFVSWIPDPESFVIDAFTLDWGEFYFYAFPPFILLPRVLRKIINDEAVGIVIVPWWPSQSWFPLFKRLLTSSPIILDPADDLLSSPFRKRHPAAKSLSLGVGRLSGKLLKPEVSQNPPLTPS